MSFSSSTKQVLFVTCLLYSMALMHCQQTKVRNSKCFALIVFISHTRCQSHRACFRLMFMATLIKQLRSMNKDHVGASVLYKHHWTVFNRKRFLFLYFAPFLSAILPFVPVSYWTNCRNMVIPIRSNFVVKDRKSYRFTVTACTLLRVHDR